MPYPSPRRSLKRRIVLVVAGLLAFTLLWVVAVRLAVENIFRGIEAQKAAGLSAIEPFSSYSVDSDSTSWGNTWISKSASLHMHVISFDPSVEGLHHTVAAHHGYLEDLRTASRPRYGRTLSASVSVPSTDFDATVSDLKTLGRIDAISQTGEDSAVKLGTARRHLMAAQTNLARLQELQRERKGELRDAVALEKDIAHANEAMAEAEREQDGLVSTVAQAHIRVTLMEDHRASLETNWAGTFLGLRNSLVAGVGAIISSLSLFLGAVFEYGLPILFWFAVLFVPARSIWRKFRRNPAVAAEAQ